MPQIFPRSTNTIAKVSLIGSLLGGAFVLWVCLVYTRSSYGSRAGEVRTQPVPFSHEHHVGILGIDCRYCHTTVEHSPYAGMPPTKTCMNCHSQIWVGSEMLAPVRQSYRDDRSLRWRRIYNIPGFVYFDHSIHVNKGVGCASCHGRIDEMAFTYQVPSLLMEWCLDCHRNPEQNLRPRDKVFDMKWQPAEERLGPDGPTWKHRDRPPGPDWQRLDQARIGPMLKQEYGVKDPHDITSCSVCHR